MQYSVCSILYAVYCMQYTVCSISYFTVKLKEDKYPEIWYNGKWSPICGHFFGDNDNDSPDYGASLFCQMLNSTYTSGTVLNRDINYIPLASDGMRIGRCTSNDKSLFSCTGGCNDLELGGQCIKEGGKCYAGEIAGVEIKCS